MLLLECDWRYLLEGGKFIVNLMNGDLYKLLLDRSFNIPVFINNEKSKS